jgi:predicted nucleic acid-binding protein
MDTVLVDTDVFSYLLKNDTRAALYRKHLDGRRLALCFMTVAELHSWAVERNWGTKKLDELRDKLRQYLVLHSDDATVEQYAAVRNVRGFPVNVGDAWIAATALRHGIALVTHNRKHFEQIPGLAVRSEA